MARLSSFAALIALLSLTGCSTVSVESRLEPRANLGAYGTFVQAPPPRYSAVGLPGYTLEIGERIGSAIGERLEAKGYAVADAPDADLLVAFDVEGERRRHEKVIPIYKGQQVAWERSPALETYTEGRVVIEIYDAETRRILWQGIGETEIFGSDRDDEVARKVVDAILAEFPGRSS